MEITSLVMGYLGGDMNKLQQEVDKLIRHEKEAEWVVRNMQKTVLMESEIPFGKVVIKVIQKDCYFVICGVETCNPNKV